MKQRNAITQKFANNEKIVFFRWHIKKYCNWRTWTSFSIKWCSHFEIYIEVSCCKASWLPSTSSQTSFRRYCVIAKRKWSWCWKHPARCKLGNSRRSQRKLLSRWRNNRLFQKMLLGRRKEVEAKTKSELVCLLFNKFVLWVERSTIFELSGAFYSFWLKVWMCSEIGLYPLFFIVLKTIIFWLP